MADLNQVQLPNGGTYNFVDTEGRKEENLVWGGPSKVGDVSPIGMALSNEHSANRMAFFPGEAIKLEYSSNGGSTYTEYPSSPYSVDYKKQLCTDAVNIPVGRTDASTNYSTSSRTRITFTVEDGTHNYMYSAIRKMLIQVSLSGKMNVKLEGRTGTNYINNVDTWADFGTYALQGWSGWNDIPLIQTIGGGSNQTGQYWQLRLTFIITEFRSEYPTTASILSVRMYGASAWSTPSTMARTGHLYTFDNNQNATFPAQITATKFNGTATTANQLNGMTATSSQTWGNQTGTFIHGENDSTGGSWAFRRDNPSSGQVSMILDGTVYIKEGGVNVSDAIKSITRSGTTFTYTTLWGNTGTFTQQDNNTTYTFANGTNGFTVTPSGGSAQTVTVTPSIANNVTGSGTNGYIAKFNGGNTITNGPQLGSSTTTFLRNDGQWATPAAGSDVNVTQTATSTSANYEVLFSATADNTTRTEGARKNNNLTFNPSTGNLQATQLNGVAIGSSPKFTDNNTTYTFANGTNGFTVTPSGGSAQTVTVTPSITNNVTGSGTSGYLTKFNGANTITNGPQLGSSTTTFLSNAGTWLTPDGRGNKIFTTTPTTPYKVGDLYIEDDNNIYVCNTARSSGSYNSDDWGGAVAAIDNDTMENYVDGVLANAFGTNGGNVLWRLDANGKPYEFLVTDTPGNLNGKIWRWDGNGLRFSSSGYSGSYITLINSNGRFAADYLTGTFNANNLTIQNFSAAKISGGIFTRGNSNNNSGTIEVRDGSGVLIGEVNNAGFKFYGAGNVGSRPYFIFNNSVGFAGYNASGALTFQISTDEFHIQKLYADAQLTIGGYLKAVPVNNGTNKGISFVKAY